MSFWNRLFGKDRRESLRPQRLDYLFLCADPRLRVRNAEIAFAAPISDAGRRIWPSDHFGVVCELEILT